MLPGVDLKPHQLSVLRGMKDQPGILAAHKTGSGKTILGLASRVQRQLYTGKPTHALVIAPNKVKNQYQEEVKRLGQDPKYFMFGTYDDLRKAAKWDQFARFLDKNDNILIFDEAHRLTTLEASMTKEAIRLAKYADFVLCTTATPIVNSQFDLAPLTYLVAGKEVLTLNKNAFLEEFACHAEQIRNRAILESAMMNLVSVYTKIDPNDLQYYPTMIQKISRVKMTEAQLTVYTGIEEKDIAKIKGVIKENGEIDESKMGRLNSFMNKTRQLCNSVQKFLPDSSVEMTSPKLVKIVKTVKKGAKPAVIFSHFITSGIDILEELCKKSELKYGVITGSSKEDPQAVVSKYNTGKLDVLLLSTAGSEGLDLKGTRQLHIADQPWTDSKMQQVVGRAVRFKSHMHLSEKKRNVKVTEWISVKKMISADYLKGGSTEFRDYDLEAGEYEEDMDTDEETDMETDEDEEDDEDMEDEEEDMEDNEMELEGGKLSPQEKLRRLAAKQKLVEKRLRAKEAARQKKEAAKAKARAKKEERILKAKAKKELAKLKKEEKSLKAKAKAAKSPRKSPGPRAKSPAKSPRKSPAKKAPPASIPSADQLLRLINLRKRHVTSLFLEVLECASIEANTLEQGRHVTCKSPTRKDSRIVRTKLKLGEIVE